MREVILVCKCFAIWNMTGSEMRALNETGIRISEWPHPLPLESSAQRVLTNAGEFSEVTHRQLEHNSTSCFLDDAEELRGVACQQFQLLPSVGTWLRLHSSSHDLEHVKEVREVEYQQLGNTFTPRFFG